MAHLVAALNAAYDEDEDRGFVKKRVLALALTVGAVAFVNFALALIGVVPVVAERIELGVVGTVVVWVVRWGLLLVAMMIALAALYRWAPARDAAKFRWTSPGALVATIIWLIASALFSLYVSKFGSYNETYGSLGAVVVLMLWLQLTALVVVLGAELNAELERQTRRDLGRRRCLATPVLGLVNARILRRRCHHIRDEGLQEAGCDWQCASRSVAASRCSSITSFPSRMAPTGIANEQPGCSSLTATTPHLVRTIPRRPHCQSDGRRRLVVRPGGHPPAMSDPNPEPVVEDTDEKYSSVDADNVVEDAKELFEQHHEGPPRMANPEAGPS